METNRRSSELLLTDVVTNNMDLLKESGTVSSLNKLVIPHRKPGEGAVSEKLNLESLLPQALDASSAPENRLILREAPRTRKLKRVPQETRSEASGLRDNCRFSIYKEQIAESENVIICAKEIGLDVSPLERTIRNLVESCSHENLKAAQNQSELLKTQMRDLFSEQIPILIKKLRKDIRVIEDHGKDGDIPRILATKARKALKQEKYLDALTLLNTARRKITDVHNKMVIEIISEARGSFALANKIGLDIGPSIALLGTAREMLRLGEINDAMRCAAESREIVNRKLNEYRNSINLMISCIQSLKIAHLMGIDLSELSPMLIESKNLFRNKEYLKSSRNSENVLSLTKKAIQDKVSASIRAAERALELAKKSDIDVSRAESLLKSSRVFARNENHLKAFILANSSLYESNSVLVVEMENRSRAIRELTDEISEEMQNLSKTQEAILHSKNRSLERIREYSNIYERLVNEAYDSAYSYTHVSRDILRQAVKKSIQKSLGDLTPMIADDREDGRPGYVHPELSLEPQSGGEKRLEIVQLYLSGKISADERDRLLSEIDCEVAKSKLV